MRALKEIEWKHGIIYACAGQSSQLVTKQYFKDRSGISSDKTINKIVRDWQIKFKD